MERHSERANFRSDIGNRMLLWHGSVLTNFGGILSQGLKIAPPEAPVVSSKIGIHTIFVSLENNHNCIFANRKVHSSREAHERKLQDCDFNFGFVKISIFSKCVRVSYKLKIVYV